MARTAAIFLRVDPEVRAAAEKAAVEDRRTLSSLVDKILVEWLRERGYLPKPKAG